MWPKFAFGDQKGLIRKKDMSVSNPPHHGTKNCGFFEQISIFIFLLFMGQKVVFWVKKRCFLVSWTGCEVADLKQRKEITTMDHRNKIQSLVLPIYDPGHTPDCITEYGPCTCEYGRMCHTAPTAQKYGFSSEPKLHLAFLVRPEPPNSYGQPRNMANSAQDRGKHPCGPKKSRKKNEKVRNF